MGFSADASSVLFLRLSPVTSSVMLSDRDETVAKSRNGESEKISDDEDVSGWDALLIAGCSSDEDEEVVVPLSSSSPFTD